MNKSENERTLMSGEQANEQIALLKHGTRHGNTENDDAEHYVRRH